MKKILLVDDDVVLTSLLGEYLRHEDFDVEVAHDGLAGARAALSNRYSLIVLDVMMPRLSGIETLRRIRMQSKVPVLMLTARGQNLDRIVGLDMGADDYVPKPCTPGELCARIRAILRRTEPDDEPGQRPPPELFSVGELVMWPARRKATWLGQALELTGTEFLLLAELARHAGRLVSKQELSQRALGRPLAQYDRSIDVHLSSIRQKLGPQDDGHSRIQNVRGVGYQLLLG